MFNITKSKFVNNIDTLYLSVFIKGDSNNNNSVLNLINDLHIKKDDLIASQMAEDIFFYEDLKITLKGVRMFVNCLNCGLNYDIFIADKLMNKNTNRIMIQFRSFYLWTFGIRESIIQVHSQLVRLLQSYGLEIDKIKENRLDYCYHTNYFTTAEKYFSLENLSKCMLTSLEFYQKAGDITHYNDLRVYFMHLAKNNKIQLKRYKDNKLIEFEDDYVAFGRRKSNNVFPRIYNKTKEVIQMGNKCFFFSIWHTKGLISDYDLFCLGYAYTNKNYDYIYRARLEFLLKHTNCLSYKDDRGRILYTKDDIKDLLHTRKGVSLKEIKDVAEELTPPTTLILNVEFETKSKLYYYSTDMIDLFKINTKLKSSEQNLKRIFKVIDNCKIFTDYITEKVLVFLKSDAVEFDDYADWWERLRTKKIKNSLDVDSKLIREYSLNLDKELLLNRLINNIGSNSALNELEKDEKKDCDFVEDIMDILSNLNDNDQTDLRLISEYGEVIENIRNDYLARYKLKKHQSKLRYKYKLKKIEEKNKEKEVIKNNEEKKENETQNKNRLGN